MHQNNWPSGESLCQQHTYFLRPSTAASGRAERLATHAGMKYRWLRSIMSSVSSAHISAFSTATQTLGAVVSLPRSNFMTNCPDL